MPATGTLLCIHRDPSQLSPLRDKGYGLITASNGSDGLRILMLNPVDAIVIEYYLGLLNGAVVADVVKQVRPHLPIVMIADPMELPVGTLKSVDVVVAKSDGPALPVGEHPFCIADRACPATRRNGEGSGHTWTSRSLPAR